MSPLKPMFCAGNRQYSCSQDNTFQLTITSNCKPGYRNISQEHCDEQQTGPPIIVPWLLNLEHLVEARLFAVVHLCIAILLLRVLWRRWTLWRNVVVAILWRLLVLIIGLLWLLWCASVVARCFALLRHCDAEIGACRVWVDVKKIERRGRWNQERIDCSQQRLMK